MYAVVRCFPSRADQTTTCLGENGCAGAIVEGCTRTQFIQKQGFPVFSRYETPKDCIPRWELREWNVLITVGGVIVDPDNVVVADSDGVVVVPWLVVTDMLNRATAVVESENAVRIRSTPTGRSDPPSRSVPDRGHAVSN